MDKPKVAGTSPKPVILEEGKKYAWCTCGLSSGQPWCNGAHKGTSFTPIVFTAEETKKKGMCTCKLTANPPYCDGAHKQLTQK